MLDNVVAQVRLLSHSLGARDKNVLNVRGTTVLARYKLQIPNGSDFKWSIPWLIMAVRVKQTNALIIGSQTPYTSSSAHPRLGNDDYMHGMISSTSTARSL